MSEFLQHLWSRCKGDPNEFGFIDRVNELYTRFIYNTSGQIVGYQKYNHRADKNKRNSPSEGRYFTYFGEGKTGCMGIENITPNLPLYIVEGMFEQITATQYSLNCVAVLGNHPKHLRNYFACYPHNIIALCQDDKAGHMLGKLADKSIILPYDLDDMTIDEVIKLIGV
jgi:DNA primase